MGYRAQKHQKQQKNVLLLEYVFKSILNQINNTIYFSKIRIKNFFLTN